MNQNTSTLKKLPKQLLNLLSDQRTEIFESLIELVKIESPSGNRQTQQIMFEVIERHLDSIDFRTRRVNTSGDHVHLYARPATRDRKKKIQLFLGHSDTVWDVGTLDENPIEIDENRIKGPGVYDMKSGIIEILYALKALGTLGIDLPATPTIFLNSDEEIGSPSSTRYIKRFAKCADRVFVLEPSFGPEGKIKTERKGIGHFVVQIQGKAAHAGIDPEQGSNAIVELSRIVQKLNQLNAPDKGLTVNVGKIDGGMRTNVVAPESKAEIDVRVPTNDLSREIEDKIRSLEPSSDEFTLNIEGGFRRPPMEFTEANRTLWEQVKESAHELDIELDRTATGGASDGNTASQHAPTIDGMGAVGDGAHEKYEFIYKDHLIQRIALLALSMTKPIA